jgi:micrococcal nuclease
MGEVILFRRKRQRLPFLLPMLIATAVTGGVYAWLHPSAVPYGSPAKLASDIGPGMKRCSGPVRVTCVVDGDTFWLNGEKIRIENIDAPEMTGVCTGEPAKAEEAARRLSQLLTGKINVARYGKDKYGRTLARVIVGGNDIGDRLIDEGLARAWPNGPKAWCGV